MGAVCGRPVAKNEVFDPKDYMLIDEHEKEIARSSEQKNLLRFKVEVLINMLAIEDKKMGALTKRLEVLKWTMLSKGVTEDGLTNILKSFPDTMMITNDDQKSTNPTSLTSAVDLSGAIERLSGEFTTNKKDIVQSFADDEGKVVTSLSRDEFMRQLYAATEHVSKSDIHAISLRFFDGSTVSIVEFIEFFMTPNTVRQAKAAASAVRMSLDLLQLDQHHEDRDDMSMDDSMQLNEPETQLVLTSSHNTRSLDRGTSSLSVMWRVVQFELHDSFDAAEDLGDQIVLLQTFKKILTAVCGVKSKTLRTALANAPHTDIKPLDSDEIDILAERFEIGGRVHYGHFLQFFREMADNAANAGNSRMKSYKAVDGSVQMQSSRPKPKVGISPFRMSSEWASLKAEAVEGKEKEKKEEKEKKAREQAIKDSEREREREREMYNSEMSAIDDRLAVLGPDGKKAQPAAKSAAVDMKKAQQIEEGLKAKVKEREKEMAKVEEEKLKEALRAKEKEALLAKEKALELAKKKKGKDLTVNAAEDKHDTADVVYDDSKSSKMVSQNSYSPDSKVVYNKSFVAASAGSKSSASKPIRSVLGQYEEVMADMEKNEQNSKNSDNNKNSDKSNDLNSANEKNENVSSDVDHKGNGKKLIDLDVNNIKNVQSDAKNGPPNVPESHPANVPGNRKSWSQSLFGVGKGQKSDDIIGDSSSLKRPQPANSPVGKGVSRFLPWGKKEAPEDSSSSPVAL